MADGKGVSFVRHVCGNTKAAKTVRVNVLLFYRVFCFFAFTCVSVCVKERVKKRGFFFSHVSFF